jgi:hypothetical protein
MSWSPKSPADVADYYIDWTAFLAATELISSVTVTADAGLAVGTTDFTGQVARVRLSGGTAGNSYAVTCLINTSSNETFSVTKNLIVQNRVEPW